MPAIHRRVIDPGFVSSIPVANSECPIPGAPLVCGMGGIVPIQSVGDTAKAAILNWRQPDAFIEPRSGKEAVSYCGLCGDERSSADKVMRMPLSKQRSKHIQHVLVEAAKLAPRQSAELALIHQKAMEKGNGNRATLAVARRIVAWLLAVDRENCEFIPAEQRETRAA